MTDRMGTETGNHLLTVQGMAINLFKKAEVQLFHSIVGYEGISRIEWRAILAAQPQAEAMGNVHVHQSFVD